MSGWQHEVPFSLLQPGSETDPLPRGPPPAAHDAAVLNQWYHLQQAAQAQQEILAATASYPQVTYQHAAGAQPASVAISNVHDGGGGGHFHQAQDGPVQTTSGFAPQPHHGGDHHHVVSQSRPDLHPTTSVETSAAPRINSPPLHPLSVHSKPSVTVTAEDLLEQLRNIRHMPIQGAAKKSKKKRHSLTRDSEPSGLFVSAKPGAIIVPNRSGVMAPTAPLESTPKVDREGKELTSCPHCSFTSFKPYNVAAHVKSVHCKIRDFSCDLCDFKASKKWNLRSHMKNVHEKLMEFNCKLCDFRSSEREGLVKHYSDQHSKMK